MTTLLVIILGIGVSVVALLCLMGLAFLVSEADDEPDPDSWPEY